MELVGCCYQTMIEIITRYTLIHFLIKEFFQCRSLNLWGRTREDDTLALFDWHLEITRYVEILVRSIATLLFLGILHATIPVGLEDKLILLWELHVKVRITGIHTGLDTIIHLTILTAGSTILMGKLTYGAESQEWAETQGCGRMGIFQRITNQNTILIVLENYLLL